MGRRKEISVLPAEVLQKIFLYYLSLYDRQSCRLVNKAWYSLTVTERALAKRKTVVHSFNELAQLHPDHQFSQVHITQQSGSHEITPKLLNFLRTAGRHINSLQLHFAFANEGRINELFALMPNLHELKITSFDSEALPVNAVPLSLPSLQRLDFKLVGPANQPNKFLEYFSKTPQLKHLHMILRSDFGRAIDNQLFTDFLNKKVTQCEDCKLRLIAHNEMFPIDMKLIADFTNHVRLLELWFRYSIKYFSRFFNNVEGLSVDLDQVYIDDKVHEDLAHLMRNVTRLNFCGDGDRVDVVVPMINDIAGQLEALAVTHTGDGHFPAALAVLHKVTRFRLGLRKGRDSAPFLYYFSRLPNLICVELDLFFCDTTNVHEALAIVNRHCPKLRKAVLKHPRNLTDFSCINILSKLTQLTLELHNDSEDIYTSLRLPELRKLRVVVWSAPVPADLRRLRQNCPKLGFVEIRKVKVHTWMPLEDKADEFLSY